MGYIGLIVMLATLAGLLVPPALDRPRRSTAQTSLLLMLLAIGVALFVFSPSEQAPSGALSTVISLVSLASFSLLGVVLRRRLKNARRGQGN